MRNCPRIHFAVYIRRTRLSSIDSMSEYCHPCFLHEGASHGVQGENKIEYMGNILHLKKKSIHWHCGQRTRGLCSAIMLGYTKINEW